MCGLVGYLGPGLDDPQAALGRAARAIAHRGPDDHGIWSDRSGPIALAHRRLSILDLSPAGHQPMASANGRWIIVFNGEIYNHVELRDRLAAEPGAAPPAWRGHSDTEILLAAFDAWGIERTLAAAIGMFAFALWDREERRLHLARDRLGEKPLYYGWVGPALGFGSELKALRALPGFAATIDRAALAGFMSSQCDARNAFDLRGDSQARARLLADVLGRRRRRASPAAGPRLLAACRCRPRRPRGSARLRSDEEAGRRARESPVGGGRARR